MLVGVGLLIVNGLPVCPVTTVAVYAFRRGSRVHNENLLNLRLGGHIPVSAALRHALESTSEGSRLSEKMLVNYDVDQQTRTNEIRELIKSLFPIL